MFAKNFVYNSLAINKLFTKVPHFFDAKKPLS